MTVRRLARAGAAASALVALVAAGCGAQPATAPPEARLAISARMVVPSCAGLHPRQLPLRLAVLLEGGGRRLRVTTRVRGDASVRLAPGRYAVAPARPALRAEVVALRLDRSAVPAIRGGHVVEVAGGRHRVLLLLALHPLECNGLGAGG